MKKESGTDSGDSRATQRPHLLAVRKALPAYHRSTAEILPYVEEWLSEQPERFRKKVLKIFQYAQVEKRYSIMPPEEVFRETSFEEKNEHYARAMTDLAEQALRESLVAAQLEPENIDYLITVSCTGLMIPSVDAFLINRLGMRQDVIRLPVTEMGCAGGTSALIYARDLLRQQPGKRAAIVALESPTSTLQHRDFSMTNMVSAAIFGDGVACAILGPPDQKGSPALLDAQMYHFYDETHMMGFQLRNTGLQMVLDVEVPQKIEQHLDRILAPFLRRNELNLEAVQHYIFHPGGKKIVQMVETMLEPYGKHIRPTLETLRNYGNMSSATVLYVLQEYLENQSVQSGDYGLMLSFGPGFSAQNVLLQW